MTKSIMDKVFDVLNEENRRFAKLQNEAARRPGRKPAPEDIDLTETRRQLEEAKTPKHSRCG